MGLFGGNTAGSKGADISQWWQTQWADPAISALADQSRRIYSPFVQRGAAGVNALSDALGLGGDTYNFYEGPGGTAHYDPAAAQAGIDRSISRFRTSPGYQFQMDQGNEALLRTGAQRGNLAGGQTSMDLTRFGQGLADSEWQQYLGNLAQMSGIGLTGASGFAGVNQNQANSYLNMAQNIGEGWQKGLSQDEASNNAAQGNLLNGILGGVRLLGGLFGSGGVK